MRVEPHDIGSVMHVVKRGARGMEITRESSDQWRFVRMLYLLNDTYQTTSRIDHHMNKSDLFIRPKHWPVRQPLVAILAWTLMPNHFHLLIAEINEGGIAKFMQRLGGSMSSHFNEKYNETGSLFQGSYKARLVDTDAYLHYVFAYVVAKNVFELYPGGLKKAVKEFEKAWEWAKDYSFSSFQTAVLKKESPIIDTRFLAELDLPDKNFKSAVHNMLIAHYGKQSDELITPLILEEW